MAEVLFLHNYNQCFIYVKNQLAVLKCRFNTAGFHRLNSYLIKMYADNINNRRHRTDW
jgi:hypothetical protein